MFSLSAGVLALVALAPLLRAPAQAPADAPKTYAVTCRFSNPAYSGTCGVDEEVSARLSPDAACRQVLACLNDVRCTKSSCNATSVRGGWQLVSSAKKTSR